ncbi:hypothetical protein BaRGS_00009870, partial [Batillaria attramentaria]
AQVFQDRISTACGANVERRRRGKGGGVSPTPPQGKLPLSGASFGVVPHQPMKTSCSKRVVTLCVFPRFGFNGLPANMQQICNSFPPRLFVAPATIPSCDDSDLSKLGTRIPATHPFLRHAVTRVARGSRVRPLGRDLVNTGRTHPGDSRRD